MRFGWKCRFLRQKCSFWNQQNYPWANPLFIASETCRKMNTFVGIKWNNFSVQISVVPHDVWDNEDLQKLNFFYSFPPDYFLLSRQKCLLARSVKRGLWNEEESFELRSCYTLESSTCPSPGRDGDFMQLSPPTPHKPERPVREQNSKLIMPYLAKPSVPTWNSDPYILLKGLYLKANYFGPSLGFSLEKLSRQFWGPWQDQDETVLPFHLISPCSDPFLPPVCPTLWCKPRFAEEASFPVSSSCF